MKDIITFILVSALIFSIVNGDDNKISPILFNPLKASVPTTLTTIPITASNSTHLPELLLLGFKKEYLDNGILFYVITRIFGITPEKLTLSAKITNSTTNLRFLEDLQFTCPLDKDKDKGNNIYTFKCENKGYNVSELVVDLNTVKIDDKKLEKLSTAELTKDLNKNAEVGDLILDKEIIVMSECSFGDSKNVEIEGKFDKPISENDPKNPYLLVTDGDKKEYVPYTYSKNGAKDILTLDNKASINTDLNWTMGRINDNKSLILEFAGGHGNPNFNSTEIVRRKSSRSGLSTGGIVAIVIPCIAVLLAVAGLAFIFGNRTKPPMENIENKTIGINSSAAINNK
jgi:hypothetical protein